jgi:hypothetical protein
MYRRGLVSVPQALADGVKPSWDIKAHLNSDKHKRAIFAAASNSSLATFRH